jgi:hypothetical protein
MLLASILSAAPFRSLLDSDYRWQLGLVGFDGRVAAIPAFITLSWAFAAAWITVGKGQGGWMWLIAAGDVLFCLRSRRSHCALPFERKFGISEIQFGESFVLSGMKASLILLLCFVVPPMWSGIWAARRARSIV